MKCDKSDFAGRTAIVTGAGNGIGRASAIAFASLGANVMVVDIDAKSGAAVVQEITDAGGSALFHHADLTHEASVAAMVAATLSAFGGLHIAHNNVGFSWGKGFTDITEEEWDRTVDLSLKAPWLCMKYELPAMLAQGGGAIVNTASSSAVRTGDAANVAYSAAKAGVLHMTRYAAIAYADRGIRVNAVTPGMTRTKAIEELFTPEQQNALAATVMPIGRVIEPDEIAQAVIWLCSDRSAMVTGDNIHVCGGTQAAIGVVQDHKRRPQNS